MNHLDYKAIDIRSGDEKAFEAFFRMEYNNILHFINAYLNDVAAAEDLSQETFIALWNKRMCIDEKQNLRAYVFKIARNKTLNYIRDNHISDAVTQDKEILMNLYALSDEKITQEIDALQLEELINKTYSSLPYEVKEVFVMNRVKGFTYSQIAETQQVEVKSVEYKIRKALQIFKKKLKHYTAMLMF